MKEQQLRSLLADMSLKEKTGQLTQLDASCFNDKGPITGQAGELGICSDDFNLAGSILGVIGAEEIKKLQKLCMEQQPHHIPLLFMADIINGYKTIFPIPLALGCSFEPEAAKTVGAIMAEEAAAAGLHVTFAPMVDLARDARWGRVMESTGEDPYLNAKMAAAMVEGIQGDADSYDGHLGACTKHFAGYGAPTAGREYNTVELSERTLRDDYLPSYKAAIDAGSAMVMTSFNTLDRIPATGNEWLMREILRKEMGFNGVLISDWNAIGELITHGVAEGKKDAALQAIKAGVDMDMMSGCYMVGLEALVEEKIISEELIDEAVWRILKLKNRLGLFENPYRNAGLDAEKRGILTESSRKKAREIAAETMVLLENKDGIFPLSKEEDVAFIGPYTDEKNMLGAWSFFGNPQDSITVKEAILEKNCKAEFEKGCEILNSGQRVYGFRYHMENATTQKEQEEMVRAAVALAKNKKKAVLFLGEAGIQTGEGGSRGNITIPDIQKKLLEAIYQVNQNLAVVLFAGRPLDIREIKKKAKGILYAWMPGTEGGHAVTDILYADVLPQARLSMSLPYCAGQVPVFYGELKTGRHTMDGDKTENRFLSKYMDIPNSPLYSFGYGMGYTSFEVSQVKLESEELKEGDVLLASVTVENTGKRPGTETLQLYIADECASVARPIRELKGFKKLTLMPGQSKKVEFEITTDLLRFHGRQMKFQAEKGLFTIYIGSDSNTENKQQFWLI